VILFLGMFDCDDCKGEGSVDCTCSCSFCSGKGKIRKSCTACNDTNRIVCDRCRGAGRIVVGKRLFFGEKHADCYQCRGATTVKCSKCNEGKVEVTCANCAGNGAQSSCPHCGGRKKIKCSTCHGEGDIRPNWSTARMREEIAHRVRQIENSERLPNPMWSAIDRWNREISQLRSWL